MYREKIILIGIVILGALSITPVHGENGITDNEIILGQSCALSGPAMALGSGMRAGLSAYFSEVNASGGIQGRKIRLISMDDGYEPFKAIKNSRTLINKDKVFMLIGGVGTPTAKAVVPMVEREKVPFFGPFTGAEFLRTPFKRYVINIRGSYYQEMEKLTQYIVDQAGLTKIACFYQNDGYGQAGLEGLKRAMAKRSLALIATGTYERNSTAVKSGLLEILRSGPQAVVMVGAYKSCATFISLAKLNGMTDVLYCNISFVGSEALRRELNTDGEGVVISQVVKYPWDATVPLVREYIAAMKKYQPNEKIGFVSLEGYMVAKFFGQAVDKVQGKLTRENLIDSIDSHAIFDLGGVELKFGPRDHQGMDEVFLTVIRSGNIVPF